MDETTIDQEREGLPGCSELHRIMACPGYLKAKATFPKSKPIVRKETQAGTEAHQALEAMEYVIDGQPVEMTEKAAQDWVVENCRSLAQKVTTDVFGENPKLHKPLVEQRMFMSNNGVKLLSGKADRSQANETWDWLIIDYKSGSKAAAPATENWQLHGLALCLESHIGTQPTMMLGGAIYGAIIQPLVTMFPKIVKIEPDTARSVKRQVVMALKASEVNSQVRIPGEHCKYCPVAGSCPEAQMTSMVFERKFSDVSSLSPEQLRVVLKAIPLIRDRCDEIVNHAKQLLFADANAIPGLKLIEQSNGSTVDDKVTLAKLLDPVITKAEFTKMLRVPLTELVDLYADRVSEAEGITKKDAKTRFKDIFGHLLVPRPQKLVIKEADGQPA